MVENSQFYHTMAYIHSSMLLNLGKRKALLKQTSSLNKYFMCHHCDKKCDFRSQLVQHLKTCLTVRTCSWCNITFKNRGNLVRHAFCVHGDKGAIKKYSDTYSCAVCSVSFPDTNRLKYHIRRLHFNLKAKIMSYEDKKINQVWFEKVYNTSKVVEIIKAGPNHFLIRKIEDDTGLTIQECKKETDLTELYPIRKEMGFKECPVCKRMLMKRALKKHIDETHMQIKKHHCNNCNKTFKRSVAYVRHVCNKGRKRRRKTKEMVI